MYIYTYICMYVYIHVHIFKCIYIYMYVYIHVCIHVCMYVYTYICIYIYLYICINTYTHTRIFLDIYIHVPLDLCISFQYVYPPDSINHVFSLPDRQISAYHFTYRSVQIILCGGSDDPGSNSPHKILRYWFYYSIWLSC